MTNNPVDDLVAREITMIYRNYRGEIAERTVTPLHIWWGTTDWHPEPGWLMTAFDHDKQADRDFSLADCQFAALTPTSAEPVAWRSVERKFYRSEWELGKLLEARRGGLVTDEGEAWIYVYSHKDGTGGEYDLLRRREPLRDPTPMTVEAAAVLDEITTIISNGDLTQGVRLDMIDKLALRALSGEKS